jgi:3-oxoadipate enol-lactonase
MKIHIENGFLEYNKRGSGIPLMFIHGYPLSRKIWVPQLDDLTNQATMISVDLRGHGDSFPFKGPYSMDLLADDCKRVLDALHIKSSVIICGLSMGGYVTMSLYRKYPELFSGMILTSTRPGPDSPEVKANRDASIKNVLEHGADFIADNMLQKLFSPVTPTTNPNLVNMVHRIMANTSVQGIVGALQGMRDRPDSTPLLTQISCPVLIIHGTDDQLIPMKEAELMAEQIPNSHLIKIGYAGHLPNLEQPDIFNQSVRDFLISLA